MTADDSIKCRCGNSGMTVQVGGFQNPRLCLQAFPSFLPHPLPARLLAQKIKKKKNKDLGPAWPPTEAFLGELVFFPFPGDEIRAPLKTPAWEARPITHL